MDNEELVAITVRLLKAMRVENTEDTFLPIIDTIRDIYDKGYEAGSEEGYDAGYGDGYDEAIEDRIMGA